MVEVLQTWLRDRLGVIIDLSPDNFGLATRDGTLLAQLLHSYDIIENAQLNTIIETQDPALARVNLKHLRVWLKFIGVDCDDDTIEDISNGRGTTAARLFYKIFVSLESKDKLHFITQQKEREKFIPNSSKFDVTTVPDRPPTPEPYKNPLAEGLVKNARVIAWHRGKFEAILARCKQAREKCIALQKQRTIEQKPLEGNVADEKLEVLTDDVSSVEREIQDIGNFTEKHKVRSPDEYTYQELCDERKYGEKIKPIQVDPEAAKTYIKSVKNRTRQTSAIFSCRNQMEKELMAKLWEKQRQDQETEFDQAIAKKLFSQSQYEKQMMTKLCEIRDQKRRIARNRGLVDELIQDRIETEGNLELGREHEVIAQERADIQAECLRLCELHRRIHDEKIRIFQKKQLRLCRGVLDDLVDISLKAVDYRKDNDNFIPAKIWNEWKALFIKSQPIFETVEHVESLTGSKSEENTEKIFRADIERQDILNDADFENYLNIGPPWDEFMPELDLDTQEILRLGIIVLGYVVHRLLEYIHPSEPDPEPVPLPKVSSACILLGVSDASVYPIIQTLLKHRRVKLILMEHAINYCLLCYKNEIKNSAYIDLNSLGSRKGELAKSVDGEKKTAIKKQGKPIKTPQTTATTSRGIDEETQTPHAIPNDDMSPDLSNPAFIGKWTHQYLTLGQPIPNKLSTKILIEYMKSLTDIKGWVLVDYPNTYNQMAQLEMALTGLKVPLVGDGSNYLDNNIEEASSIFSGTSCEAESADESSILRESRLVCDSLPKNVGGTFKSYMTAYIRALPKPKNVNVVETDIHEILPEDSTPMDAFYTEQGLAYAVYYTSLNKFTLKRICRIAIGDMSIPRIPSEELFGDGLDLLKENTKQTLPSKKPMITQLVRQSNSANIEWHEENEYEGEDSHVLDKIVGEIDNESIPPKPGEDGWNWIKFPQAPTLLEALATLWENMETVYIEDLKEIFFMKRFHYSNIVPYRNFVTKHMDDFIERPDIKQDMLHTFHTNYNNIPKDIRDDLDVKCELHCRIVDFRKKLWEICDERRKQAEDERQRVIFQDWTTEEMVGLANLYSSMIKAEIDRCIDTVQLIQDYYTSMLQRPINEIRLTKHSVQRLELGSNELTISASTPPPAKANKALTEVAPSSKGGQNVTSRDPQTPTIDCSLMKKQVADLLIVAEREPFDSAEMTCYKAVHTNIMYVQNVVESLASSLLESLEKEQVSLSPDGNGRVPMPKAQVLPTADTELIARVLNRGPDLCEEWRSSIQFEINRMRVRLQVLDRAALSDISFLQKTMERCFHGILKHIDDRYDREIKSVNDVTAVFCHAIEEGIPIQEELLLDGDRFVVRSNVLLFPDNPTPTPELIQEAIPSQFRLGQLGHLMDVLRYVAPHGSLPEQCFTHILQDMVACREEAGEMVYLPSSWSELRTFDISNLITEIFGGSEFIDWREFIIYAMDIPMPSDEEILDVRSQFIAMDPTLTENVTRDQFHSVKMWFSYDDHKDLYCQNLIHEDSRRDEEEMLGERGECPETEKTNGLILKNIKRRSDSLLSGRKCHSNNTSSSCTRTMTPQEMVRCMVAKELICDMYASKCDTVNYTAFLLAFCKGTDPREGFGKALTLAIGDKVCTSLEGGEKFVAELLEQQRLTAVQEVLRNDEREAAEKNASSVINHVLENTLELTEGITISEIDDSHECVSSAQSIVSQHEQHIRIKYPNVGLPGNARTSQPDIAISPTIPASSSKESYSSETNREASTPTILNEGYSKESLGMAHKHNVVHWIPREVCQSVLVASLPWHARQPDILGTACCLRECLEKVYADIFDSTISDDRNNVLSHRLVNHEFIVNLLNSTTAFTVKNIRNIIQNLLDQKSDTKQASK